MQAPLSTVSSVRVWASFENRILELDLIEAAMRACDRYGDNEVAREEMRSQCRELSPRLQADLLEHFTGTYPRKPASAAHIPDNCTNPENPTNPESPLP